MKNKFIILLASFFLLSSCAGLNLNRSENSDEFLIEKKNPLVMPPDINDLPKPKQSIDIYDEKDNDFEKTLKSSNKKVQKVESNSNKSLTESIIKKIEE